MSRPPPQVEPRRASNGRLVGSRVRHGALVWELPQFPKRVRAVTPRPDGALEVRFEDGHARLLEPLDAIA